MKQEFSGTRFRKLHSRNVFKKVISNSEKCLLSVPRISWDLTRSPTTFTTIVPKSAQMGPTRRWWQMLRLQGSPCRLRPYLWPAIHFFSSLLGVSWHPDDQRKVLAVEGPTCWNLPWTSVCNRSSSLPYESIYFLTEPNSFCSFKNSLALWIVALIFFSLRTIPPFPIN